MENSESIGLVGHPRITFSGKPFYPLSPRAEDILISDIAHALPFICRYTGQCNRFYSVAEHSIVVARGVASATKDIRMILTALLHDASEAYLSDIVTPIKNTDEMSGFRKIETRVEAAIALRFGLYFPLPEIVKHYDARALVTEASQIVNNKSAYSWPDVRPLDVDLSQQPSFDRVRSDFLFMFATLTQQLRRSSMLDIKVVISSPDMVKAALARRGRSYDAEIDAVLLLHAKRRALLSKSEELAFKLKERSKCLKPAR